MFSMPLAITGAIFGLLITGNTITMPAMMGFVMLVGMVVNNGIVLVDYTNQLMERGMTCYDALTTAGPRRLRPILMTTTTTVLGMIPMAVGSGVGAEMWNSLGMSVAWGLAFSTLITLILIPTLFAAFAVRGEKRREKMALKEANN
jgi:HAE1 family hydrophobic/amphiphilic exporter-1